MAQKRKTDQSKLAAASALLRKLEEKAARAVKGHLSDNWRDNIFEIMMTRIDLAGPHQKGLAAIPSLLRQQPREIPKFSRIFFRTMHNLLVLAKAPSHPHHVAAFSLLYASVIDVLLKDDTKDHAKTMAALDQRLAMFEQFSDYTQCRETSVKQRNVSQR